jgi:hypothetical protein
MGRKNRNKEKEFIEYSDSETDDEPDLERLESLNKEKRYCELREIYLNVKRYCERYASNLLSKSSSMHDFTDLVDGNGLFYPEIDEKNFEIWKKKYYYELNFIYSHFYNSSFQKNADASEFLYLVYHLSSNT